MPSPLAGHRSPPHTEEEDNSDTVNAQDTKPKRPIDSNLCDNFDFNHWASEADVLALPLTASFLDFDSIKEWMEEMQSKQEAEASFLGGLCDSENLPANNEACGDWIDNEGVVSDLMVEGDGCGVDGGNSVAEHCDGETAQGGKAEQSDGTKEVKATFDNVLPAPFGGTCDETLASAPDDIGEKLETGGAEELQGLSSAVEDRIGRVSLTDDLVNSSLEENHYKVSEFGNDNKASFDEAPNSTRIKLGDESGNGGLPRGLDINAVEGNCEYGSKIETDDECESSSSSEESSSSSSSSASSSSSSEESSDDDCEVSGEKRDRSTEVVAKTEREVSNAPDELEEGEIVEAGADKMVSWSHGSDSDNDNRSDMDDAVEDEINEECFIEDDEAPKGPIRSKNEVSMLPPVLPVDVVLQPSHQMSPVGAIISIMGAQIVVEGSEKHNPLSEGSILWVSETRLPLGRVDEIFGPVKNPFYIVRFNSENEVSASLSQGILVSYVPEFVDHVLNDKNLYQKGYDASGENDEEVLDEAEFSDDEKEAEYRKMMKQSKRGHNDMTFGLNKKRNDKPKRNGKPPVWNTPYLDNPAKHSQGCQPHSEKSLGLITHGSQPYPSGMRPFPPPGQRVGQAFPQPLQQPPRFAPNGFQQGNNMASPGGFQQGNNMAPQGGFQQGNNMAPQAGFPQGGSNMTFSGGFQCGSSNMAFSNGFQPNNNEQMKQLLSPGQQVRPSTMPFANTTAQPPFQQPGGHNHSNPNSGFNSAAQPPYPMHVGHNQNMNVQFGQQGPNLNSNLNTAAQPPFQQPVGHNQNMTIPYGQQGPNPNLNPGQGFPSWPAAQPVPNMPSQAQISQGLSLLAQQLSAVPGFLPLLLNQGLLQSGGPCGQQSNMQQLLPTSFGGGSDTSHPPNLNQGFLSSGPGGGQIGNMQQQQQMSTGPCGQYNMQKQMGPNFTGNGDYTRPPSSNQGVPQCADGQSVHSTPQMSTSFTSSNGDPPSPQFNQGGSSGGRRPFHNNRGRGGRGGGGHSFRGRGGGRRGRNQSRSGGR